MMISVAYSVGVFLLFFTIHFIVWNLNKSQNLGVYHLLTIMLSTLIVMIGFNLTLFLFELDIYLTIAVYGALDILYLHFYVGITRSVSIRMLGELSKAHNHQMSYDDLEKVYSLAFMLKHRLTTLEEHGWLENDGKYFKCTQKGVRIAKLQLAMKNLFLTKQTG